MADREAECAMNVDCPHCGVETYVDFPALSASGSIRATFHRCSDCEQRFTIEATIDVGVKP